MTTQTTTLPFHTFDNGLCSTSIIAEQNGETSGCSHEHELHSFDTAEPKFIVTIDEESLEVNVDLEATLTPSLLHHQGELFIKTEDARRILYAWASAAPEQSQRGWDERDVEMEPFTLAKTTTTSREEWKPEISIDYWHPEYTTGTRWSLESFPYALDLTIQLPN